MNWMYTASGKRWYFEAPRSQDVDINDIAHALSNLCRYGGHASQFYSVAEHAVHVSHMVPREDALAGLLHDATEAYVVDVPRPLKRLLSDYKRFEQLTWRAISGALGVPYELPDSVHRADNDILFIEKDVLLPRTSDDDWGMGATRNWKAHASIYCWSPTRAKMEFLNRYKELVNEQGRTGSKAA